VFDSNGYLWKTYFRGYITSHSLLFHQWIDESSIWRDDVLSDFTVVAHEFCSRTLVSLHPLIKEGNYLNQSCQWADWDFIRSAAWTPIILIFIFFPWAHFLASPLIQTRKPQLLIRIGLFIKGERGLCFEVLCQSIWISPYKLQINSVIECQQVATKLAITPTKWCQWSIHVEVHP